MEPTVKDFHHPYKPYDIQFELMNVVYQCIVEGKVGILESPTGTGKSLSLICSSLTWLRDFQEEALQSEVTLEKENDEPGWVVEQAQAQRGNALIERKLELEARLRQVRAKELRQKQSYENSEPKAKRTRVDEVRAAAGVVDITRFELDEYNSDDEDSKTKTTSRHSTDPGVSSASLNLMQKLLGLIFKPTEEEDVSISENVKIYFCSRTHSQLAQFVQELKRVKLPDVSWAVEKNTSGEGGPVDDVVVKHLPLGSRKNLCINSKVSQLSNLPAINERCLELQQPDTPKDHKCPFIPSKENETLVNDFRDHTLAKIRDIEDLGKLGTKIGICPYYASRAIIKPSEIVTLPYPLLLQKSAREALDISLKGHVVIIDEAHNLMDTISNIHSITVTQGQLKRCRSQLSVYLQKFRNKLKGKNRVYVAQVVRLIDSISGCLETKMTEKQSSEGMVNVSHLMAGKGVDQINLYKLMRYLQESKLARKVEGYTVHAEDQELKSRSRTERGVHGSITPVLTHIQSFLQTLTNPAAEGRFFYEKDEQNDVSLKYMLLDPTHHFKEIVEDARAVILAGGTMSPMDDYVRHLFAYVDPARLRTFSCGHIIPKENLIALPVAKGPGGIDFDFTFDKRNSPAMIEALGTCLLQLASTVPDGLVVFFPSYAYLDQVVLRWQAKSSSGATTKPLWDRLQETKPIFRESKTTSTSNAPTDTDNILNHYTQAIAAGANNATTTHKGALLLSVTGGKLSEGINFSDALGRAVVVVGLPFPNVRSPAWKAKLEHVQRSAAAAAGNRQEGGRGDDDDDGKKEAAAAAAAARDFAENACMRAVNQCIGRVVRHRADYASVILLDRRYATARIEGKLPAWIRQGIVRDDGGEGFGGVVGKLRAFFEGKKEKEKGNV